VETFWETHWWLIIVLAVFAVPVLQAIFEPWRRYLTYRERRDAIETLKVYAAQNKEPPPDVLAALGGGRGWRRRMREAAATTASAAAGAGAAWEDAWWARRSGGWRTRVAVARWNWAIFAGAICAGFAYASQHVHSGGDTYMVVAIIAGALTIAGVVSALLATFLRYD
jgi:hypothetical protein